MNELSSNCVVSCLIVFLIICATYLCFFRTYVIPPPSTPLPTGKLTNNSLEDAKLRGNTSEAQSASYDRNHPRYPYKSHGQWLRAAYGCSACVILVAFNGIKAFLQNPFSKRELVAQYISVSPNSSPYSIIPCQHQGTWLIVKYRSPYSSS
jgi:amino acid transporter